MNAAALLALLRRKTEQHGPDAPFFGEPVQVTDPYTGERLPDAERPALNQDPVDCGDQGTVPNPVYRGMFRASMNPDGSIEITGRDGTPDLHQQIQREMYSRKKRVVKETGTYPAISTELPNQEPTDD